MNQIPDGWTEPQFVNQTLYAFLPGAVMPVPVPCLAAGVDRATTRLLINLTYGTLVYHLNDLAIVSATWNPSPQFCQAYPKIVFTLGLDLLEVSGQVVRFRVCGDSFMLPPGWETEANDGRGVKVRTIAHSIRYFQEQKAA